MKIVTSEQMRLIEERSEAAGVSTDRLMENAGLAVAERIRDRLGPPSANPVVVLVGPGNNGSDGLVAARHLYTWGIRVVMYLCAARRGGDAQLEAARARGVPVLDASADEGLGQLKEILSRASLALDSVLGAGPLRPIRGRLKEVFEAVESARFAGGGLKLVALDLPSGLDAESGAADESCLAADSTITLGHPKLGLFQLPGAELAGHIEIAPIGIPPGLADDVVPELMTERWAAGLLPHRGLAAHKGTFGRTLVVAGSRSYIGAAYLASTAAARVGAGLVTLAIPESVQAAVAARAAEPTYIPLPESPSGVVSPDSVELVVERLGECEALLVGCGVGQAPETDELLERLLLVDHPGAPLPATVVDADGLNFLAKQSVWWERFDSPSVLTPHPGEMARLSGWSTREIQRGRIGKATEAAAAWNKVVALKGAYTVVADPQGPAMVSPFANPGLASAGAGDVLAGAVAGLLSQGLAPAKAAALGVYVHGLAGEMLRAELGDAGMLASDVLHALPRAIKRIKERERG